MQGRSSFANLCTRDDNSKGKDFYVVRSNDHYVVRSNNGQPIPGRLSWSHEPRNLHRAETTAARDQKHGYCSHANRDQAPGLWEMRCAFRGQTVEPVRGEWTAPEQNTQNWYSMREPRISRLRHSPAVIAPLEKNFPKDNASDPPTPVSSYVTADKILDARNRLGQQTTIGFGSIPYRKLLRAPHPTCWYDEREVFFEELRLARVWKQAGQQITTAQSIERYTDLLRHDFVELTGHSEWQSLLLDACNLGVTVNIFSGQSENETQEARAFGRIIQTLLERGADPEIRHPDKGKTALMFMVDEAVDAYDDASRQIYIDLFVSAVLSVERQRLAMISDLVPLPGPLIRSVIASYDEFQLL